MTDTPPMSTPVHRLRRATPVVVVLLTLSLLGVAGIAAPASAASGAEARSARYERAVVAQVNRARAAEGLGPVRVVPCVDAVAEDRAAALRRDRRLARISDRLMLRECRRPLELDATATGPFRPAGLVRGWLEGRGVRAALLDRRVRGVGVGAVFSRGRGWQVSLLLVGQRVPPAGGSVPVEEAAPTPDPGTSEGSTTDPDSSMPGSGDDGTTDPGAGEEGGTTGAEDPAGLTALESAILEETNRRRGNHGLTPLEPSSCATAFAGEHSAWMAQSDDLAHADLADLQARCGVPGVAENIAAMSGSSLDAQSVVQAWMDSPGHRANILDPDLTHLGVGVVHDADSGRWYATQDFLDAA